MSWFGISLTSAAPAIQRGGLLDLMRFGGAFLIIIYHYQWASPVPLAEYIPALHRGYLLTDFFIIDSGYVLARIYGSGVRAGQVSFGGFMSRRLLRVIPAHLFVLSVLIGIVLAATALGHAPDHGAWFDWSQLPAQLFLVQAYGVPGGVGWNAPTWSLSALIGCYLAFPSLVRMLGRWTPLTVVVVAALSYATVNLVSWNLYGLGVYELPLRYGFVRALPLFFLGAALARLSEQLCFPRRTAIALGWLSLAGLVLSLATETSSLVSLSMISSLIVATGALPPIRRSRLIEKAAVISFSMFITNEVVRVAWFGAASVVTARLGLPPAAQWGLWACGVLAALVCAILFHVLVDAPIQARLRNWRPSVRRSMAASQTSP